MRTERGAAIVCAGSMASSVVAARSLGSRGIPVICVAFEPTHPLLWTKHCTESHVITSPWEDFETFADSLRAIADRDHVDTFVPLNEYGIYTVVNDSDRFDSLLQLPLVDRETLDTVQDRQQLLDLATSLDVPTPETARLTEWDNLDRPSIIKPRYSILEGDGRLWSPDVDIIDPDRSPDFDEIQEQMEHEPLVQRYVTDGTEFGFFALFDEGEPVVTFQHRRIRSTNYFGGASTHRKAVRIPELRTLGERVLRELNWHGPAMVEFRRDDASGEYKLMEINPRFWGSLALSVAAGVDFPYRYYQLGRGDAIGPDSGYRPGTTASYLRGELQCLSSILFDEFPEFVRKPSLARELLAMGRSLPSTNFDLLSVTDPRPFAWDYLHSLQTVLSRRE
jgi:predicted ATP-grasp superfamily ATP-dependent carboligase